MRFSHGQMRLLHVDPTAGYLKDIEVDTPQHIDVRFTSNGHRASEIDLHVVHGRVVDYASEDGWDTRGISSVSPVSKHHAGHQVAPQLGPGGRLASAPIEHTNRGHGHGNERNRSAAV